MDAWLATPQLQATLEADAASLLPVLICYFWLPGRASLSPNDGVASDGYRASRELVEVWLIVEV